MLIHITIKYCYSDGYTKNWYFDSGLGGLTVFKK